jgi:flagellar FliL protein
MKLPIIPVLLVVVGLVVGAGGAFGATRLLAADSAGSEEVPKAAAKPVGIQYQTKERIVNLADTGLMRYLKTTVVLEIAQPQLKKVPKGEAYKKAQEELALELKGEAAAIDDLISAILSAKTSSQLLAPDGRKALKEEIKTKVNALLHEERVLDVYFTDFIVQ